MVTATSNNFFHSHNRTKPVVFLKSALNSGPDSVLPALQYHYYMIRRRLSTTVKRVKLVVKVGNFFLCLDLSDLLGYHYRPQFCVH